MVTTGSFRIPLAPATWLQWPAFQPGGYQSVVGESHYQHALEAAALGRDYDGALVKLVTAQLLPEPANPHDSNAISVLVGGQLVGYIPRGETRALRPKIDALTRSGRPATCRAEIIGGYDRPDLGSHRYSFGVALHVRDDWAYTAPDCPFLPGGARTTYTCADESGLLARILAGRRKIWMRYRLSIDTNDRICSWAGEVPAGSMTPKMSDRYRALIRACDAAGILPSAGGSLASEDEKIKVTIEIGKPDHLGLLR